MPSHRKLSSDLHRGKPLFIRLRPEESRRLSALASAYRVTKVEFLRRLLATTRDPEGVEQFVAVCRLCRHVSWPAIAETCPSCVEPTLERQRICCRACDVFVPADDLARHGALAFHLANIQRKRAYSPTPEAPTRPRPVHRVPTTLKTLHGKPRKRPVRTGGATTSIVPTGELEG